MADKIVLIDGHSILNRAFYGVPDLTNSEGLHTNAVYGFLNIMFKILEEETPKYLVVTFDVHAPTFRHKLYAEYKGNQKANGRRTAAAGADVEGDVKGHAHRDYRVCGVGGG